MQEKIVLAHPSPGTAAVDVCYHGVWRYRSAQAARATAWAESWIEHRYVVGAPLTWPEELARLCLVWVTYLGAYTVMYRSEHLALTALTDRLRPAPKAVVTVAAHLMVLVFLGVVTIFGVSFLRAMGSSQMPVSGIPYAVAYGVVWLASLLMCLEIVIRLCGDVREATKLYRKEAQ